MIQSISNMIGPVLGAALMAFLPIAAIMIVDILGAAFAIVCLLFVTIPDIPQSNAEVNVVSDMKQGLISMNANKPLIVIALIIDAILCRLLTRGYDKATMTPQAE